MTEAVEVELGGQRYVWTGRRWYDAATHRLAPAPLLAGLNRLLKPAHRAADDTVADPRHLVRLAVTARAAGDSGRAQRLARRALQLEPTNGVAAAVMSSLLRERGSPQGGHLQSGMAFGHHMTRQC